MTPPSPSSRVLAEQAREPGGSLSRDQLRGLYETHFGFVWRSLRRLGVPESSAEDAAQDVFLVVHRRHGSYDSRWSRVETWLFGIVLRVARDHRRSRRRWHFRFDPTADVEKVLEHRAVKHGGPESDLARREAVELLELALGALDDRKRAVLVMVDVEGFTVPEAAEALGVNVNTAYWRLRAGRAEFERALTRARRAPTRRKGASS